MGEGRRNRRPHEHGRGRTRHLPAGGSEPVDEDVTAVPVEIAHRVYAILRTVQRRRRRHLDRRKGAVIKIGLDAGKRTDQRRVAGSEADAPSGHGIGLAHGSELHGDVLGPRNLQDRRRRRVGEIDFGVGEIGQDVNLVMAAEIDDLAVIVEIDDLGGRVRREIQHQRQGRRNTVFHRPLQAGEEIEFRPDGDMPDGGAGNDEAVRVDGIARIGDQHHVARRGDGLGEVGEPLLGPEGDDGFPFGIDIDAEPAPVVVGVGLAQARDTTRIGVAVGARILHRLDQLLDDMGRRRAVRIAHAEIDDVFARRAGAHLHLVDLGEDIRRQPLDTVEWIFHDPIANRGPSGQRRHAPDGE